MSIFDKLVSDLSGQSKKRNTPNYSMGTYNRNITTQGNLVKMVWQCGYCGRRESTYNNVPSRGTCWERGKTRNGTYLPHEWRRIL